MPLVTIAGHSNILYLIRHNSTYGLIFGGRFHLYEGHSFENLLIPMLVPYFLGIRNFIFMNAAGGLNPKFEIGDLMIINSAVNFTKRNVDSIFEDKDLNFSHNHELFDMNWIKSLKPKLTENKIKYQEGTFFCVTGPSYETTAEIRMFRRLGGDAIGMSTLLESKAGSMLGANILAFSVITNKLKEINTSKISHKEVIESLEASKKKVEQFVRTALDVKFA
jgi:purine-nucleoside phosphorylase